MPAPGTPGQQWVADGLTHDDFGHPTNSAKLHVAGLDKRRAKLRDFDYGETWGETWGGGEVAIIAFGSSLGAAKAAAGLLGEKGVGVKVIGLRLLAPLPLAPLAAALEGARRVIVVEQNHTGQLYRHLLGAKALPAGAESLARPGPLPFRPSEIATYLGGGI